MELVWDEGSAAFDLSMFSLASNSNSEKMSLAFSMLRVLSTALALG
jgi:hypothetical protein